MRIENKVYYYFEEQERNDFFNYLKKSDLNMTTFAEKCGISLSLLSLILGGKRAITKNVIKEFEKIGFKVNL